MVASKHTALIIWMRSHILHHSLILICSNFRCLSFWTMSHIISSTNLSNIKLLGGAEVLILVLAWLVWHTHLLCLTSAENVSLIISGFVMLWMGDNMVDTCLILTLHLAYPNWRVGFVFMPRIFQLIGRFGCFKCLILWPLTHLDMIHHHPIQL